MSCDDPNCPACTLRAFFESLAAEGASPGMILELAVAVLGDMYGEDFVITELDFEEGTVH